MPRKRKGWSKTIEEAGVSIRLFARGGMIYRDVRLEDGGRDKKSLGHADRELAESQARILARRMSELRYAGQSGTVTLGQLSALYERDRVPLLSLARQRSVRAMLRLLERHFGRAFDLDDLGQHAADGYVRVRQSGALRSARHRTPRDGVSAGTIRNELHLLEAMITWGQGVRIGGRRLLAGDPMVGVVIPSEKNARRPIANQARYDALRAVADVAEPSGRFRCVLALARHTGRRINAIVSLRRSDVLLTREQLRAALAAYAMDLAHADAWPQGAIRWPSSSDKLGFEAITPIGTETRAALDDYLRTLPSLGDAPLFPSSADPSRPLGKEMAGWWLRKAERLAKLEHLERGGYHAFRRAWASERRHLPAQDVAVAAGWRSLQVMRSAYMQADAQTVLSVVESRAAGPTKGSPRKKAKAAQRVTR